MDNRKYNIYFHTHTISGIIICALLYVIFFAGSFAFFKEDLTAWQKNSSFVKGRQEVKRDFSLVFDSLAGHHNLKGRDFEFFMQRNDMAAYVSMLPSNDSTVKKKVAAPAAGERRGRRGDGDSAYFTYNFAEKNSADYATGYDIGEFLYRLHFFAQLNSIPIRLGSPFGYLLAGVVSFIFLFALITGLMLHWDKIVSNFFTFRPWSKWKTVWTDMHTALGVIGFPFQFIFALTGVVLIVNFFLLTPYTNFLYKGDQAKFNQDLEYLDTTTYKYSYKPLQSSFIINNYVDIAEEKWPDARISLIQVKNYNDDNMHVIIQSKPHADASFAGTGRLVFRVRDNQIVQEKSPTAGSSYVDKVRSVIYHLHFGDFGGRPLRVMFFVLGIMGCLIIISGILIWLVARDKSNVPKHMRVFNFWTANIFLAACLTMLPVTAFTMIVLLFLDNPGQKAIYNWYFYSWLILGLYFVARRDIAVTNKQTLLLSVITCTLLPVFNGILRNNWLWNTFNQGKYDILFVDLLFLSIAIVCAIALVKMSKKKLTEDLTKTVVRQEELDEELLPA